MERVPHTQIKPGTFLVATPELAGGFFFRGVILVCEHNATGTFGLLINKVLQLDMPEELENIEMIDNSHIGVRACGPIQPNQMMLLHDSPLAKHQTLKVTDGVYLGGDLQFLQDSLANKADAYVHLCFGYTGWASGQLEREFLDGHWYLYPASAKHIFETAPENLWQTILREMGGKYASLSMIPEDLSLN